MADQDTSGAIAGVAWCFVCICALAVIGRSVFKQSTIRQVGADDVFIWAAFFCFIGQCVALQEQICNGLGKDISEASPTMLDTEMMAEYANGLLYILVVSSAKLCVVSLMRKCALDERERLVLYAFEWVLVLWVIISEFVFAFACEVPNVWDYTNGTCVNRQAWLIFFETINMIIEVMLIVMPTLHLIRLPTTLNRRLIAISIFAARIIIIPVIMARAIYWAQGTTTQNVTYGLYPFAICTALVAALEILAACLLYIRPLLNILESEFPSTHNSRRRRVKAPTYGPYSKGTWPLTRISTADDYPASCGVWYMPKPQACFSDDEKTETCSDNGRMNLSKKPDMRRAPPPTWRRERINRIQIPSMKTESSMSDPSLFFDKSVPTTPTIQRGTFLLM